MVLRWIHKGWKTFWTVILSLMLIVVVIGGSIFGLLQLDATKDVIIEKIENDFRNSYEGRLTIGELNGLLPFNAELNNVVLTTNPDSAAAADTLASIGQARVGIDISALLRNRLTIDAFSLQKPSLRFTANGQGGYTLSSALNRKQAVDDTSSAGSSWIKGVEIIAPSVTVDSGSVYIERFYGGTPNVDLPEPFQINDINANMFVELTQTQRLLDINQLTAQIANIRAGNIEISGQLYNDEKVLEFNAFHFLAGSSHLHLNGTIDGIDLYRMPIGEQFANADYNIEVSSHRFKFNEFTDVLANLPDIEEPFDFTVETTGPPSAINLSTFRFGIGDSYFSIDGSVGNLFNNQGLTYNFNIDTLAVHKPDVEIFTGPLNARQYSVLENLRLNGQASGTSDTLSVDVGGSSTIGSFQVNGSSQLVSPFAYQGKLTASEMNIGPLVEAGIDTTSLNFTGTISGQNTALRSGQMRFVGQAQNSFINDIRIDSLRLTTSLLQGLLKADYYYRNQQQLVSGNASANFNRDDPTITLQGNTTRLNLTDLFSEIPVDSTSFNTEYEINMQGIEPDRIQGMARFEVEPSVIDGDSVESHQLRVELDSPDLASRTLQINSSLFDLTLRGDLKPSNIRTQVNYWSNYFQRRIAEEIRLDTLGYQPEVQTAAVEPMQVQGNIEAKNLTLVRTYWPSFPSLVTNSTVDFEMQADSTDLQFSSQIQSDTLRINTVQVRNAGSSFSGQFSYNQTLKESGNLRFETSADRVESNFTEMDSVQIALDYRRDSLFYAQQVKRFSDDARFNLQMRSRLSQSNIKLAIDEFFLGNEEYAWQNETTPQLTYTRAKEVIFESFRFQNQSEYIALQGTMSPDRSDSLRYVIRNVSLSRISDLLKGDLNFSGQLNGTLQTRSITRTPSIQGDLTVNRLELEDRLVGDVAFRSQFNENQNRFDTRLEVITDSTKYENYIEGNEGVGQNIVLDGYFKAADVATEQDTTFYFDADFNEIDMWAVQLLIQNIFQQLEGQASGSGYIAGNLQDVNYNFDFDVQDVYARPAFLNTNYYLDGPVSFNDEQGIVIKDVAVSDNQGGTGSLSGTVDLNDFQPLTFLDLQMELDDLMFLDNSYGTDVPFFGGVAGTGRISLSGSNRDMQLRSLTDIRVSENSSLSIPLLAETELSTNNNFIRFVDSFTDPRPEDAELTQGDLEKMGLSDSQVQQPQDDLSFNERFNIDLQFDAPNPINMRLIFDPVTGERLSARGTGRLRISMQEGDVQMFGNFDVTGGTYNFVSGQIFSRELDIRSGGSILWEGQPDNARLNIQAVYNARTTFPGTTNNTEGAPQRVPVNLVVEIAGTLSNVQNNYYFEVPQSFELTSTSELQFRLNRINNDEQEKLLQATSLLLTGNLLNTEGSESQTAQLRNELTKGSTFINPILSNQVISPLLSSQINSLLDSDVSQFDIDFNLNQYNQIDLGVALRLYNDKLVLRREGYLTGGAAGSSFGERIGDLNATYRINQNLSLTAFHRQDQIFGSIASNAQSGDFSPTVDGVGVEASVQFNTWEQLGHKVQNFFRRLIGKEEINFEAREQNSESEQENITEKRN